MRFLISLFLICSSIILISQDSIFLRKKFQNNQSNALKILGGWSTLNLIVSPIYLNHIKNRGGANSSAEYFNKMNFNWNLVNGGICIVGTFRSKTLKNKSWNNKEVTNLIIKLKKTKTINIFGTGEDNTVEAFHIKTKRILGIMWHPERYKKIKNFDKNLIKKYFS